eukprot:PhF_6_TR18628/c0_g1_i3/m.27231
MSSTQREVTVGTTVGWLFASVTAYFCFLVIPKRLQDTSYFDWVITGARLHYCIWLWPVYCVVRRAILSNTLVYPSYFLHTKHHVVIATTVVMTILLVVGTYVRHSRWVLQEYAAGRTPKDRRRLYPIKVPVVPMETWMMLWSIGFVTCFAWVDGLGIMMNELFP